MTNVPAAQNTLHEYRRTYAAYRRAIEVQQRLLADAETHSDRRKALSYYNDTYVPALEDAFFAAVALLDQIEEHVPTLRAAMGDAWAYRIEQFESIDDPDMDPDNRELLTRYDTLTTAFPVLDGDA